MTRDELKKLLVGAVLTVATPFDDDYRVDYGRMADATARWLEWGVVTGKSFIKVAAAMGEGPQLRDDEWPHLLRTVVQVADGKVPVACGIHYKDTLRTIEDAKRAQDLGAVGLQISPPIFNHPTQDDILRHYGAISNAIDIGILVYLTHWLPGGAIYPETFRKMADFEHVAVIKWSPPQGVDYDEIFKLAHIFTIFDNTLQPIRCHKLGGRGFISDGTSAYPPHYIRVWDLMEERKYDEAQALWDKVNIPVRKFYDKVRHKSGGEARVEKAMCAVMGLPLGASRPPSLPLNSEEIDELRGLMKGWGWPVPDKRRRAKAA